MERNEVHAQMLTEFLTSNMTEFLPSFSHGENVSVTALLTSELHPQLVHFLLNCFHSTHHHFEVILLLGKTKKRTAHFTNLKAAVQKPSKFYLG